MTVTIAVRNRILQLCNERDITINGLATICGLPPSSVKNILYGKSLNPKIAAIKMLCNGLDISLGSFLVHPNLTVWSKKQNNGPHRGLELVSDFLNVQSQCKFPDETGVVLI